MADRKISDLTALTTPASGDFLPIVDISEAAAASKNKRITIEELFRGVPLGSAAAPSIAIEGDEDTGVFSPGANQLAVATNGTGRLFVDASGRVGVGTAAPAQSLDIAGSAGLHLRGSTYTDFSNYWGTNDNRAMFLPYGFLGTSGGFAVSLYANGYRDNSGGFTYMGINGNTSTAAGFDLVPDGNIIFRNGTAVGTVLPERARIDSNGRLLIGTSTSIPVGGATASNIQLVGSSALQSQSRWAASASGPSFILGKSRSATPGSYTIVQDGDGLGTISFAGDDGTDLQSVAARIQCEVDGTPGANDMPGRLLFSTTADGAATPTERLRITSAGVLQVADAGNITVGTTTGTKIGTATTQKLGFYNATPVVQPTAVADATDAATAITQLNDLLAKLRTLGIIAT
jgi:hypothetical protein